MSFRKGHMSRLREIGGIHCWGGEADNGGFDGMGGFGGGSFGGGGGGGGSSSGSSGSSGSGGTGGYSNSLGIGYEGFGAAVSAVADPDGNGVAGDDGGDGVSSRGIVDAAISMASLVNPIAGLLGFLGAEVYGFVKGKTATTAAEKGFAKGFQEGPQKNALESIASLGLSLAPLGGVAPGLAAFGKTALSMEMAGRNATNKGPSSGFESSAGGGSLGSWTDKDSVSAALSDIRVSATDQELDLLVQDYNARNKKIQVPTRKSRAVTTRPERYNYLRSGWKS